MRGMSGTTGKELEGMEHLVQSIHDILTTPIGTRMMLRDYGSDLPALLDRPINAGLALEVYAATAAALDMWEPRFKLTRASFSGTPDGVAHLDLFGDYLPTGEPVTMEGILS